MKASSRGFTLIELLIVVAIIAILAAIAVPNFLEAQTRSKVSRVKSDQRTLATAIEAYHVDANKYPPTRDHAGTANAFANLNLVRLTTPIAYITSVSATLDPFMANRAGTNSAVGSQPVDQDSYYYVGYADFATAFGLTPNNTFAAWGLSSLGPDGDDNGILNSAWLIQNAVATGSGVVPQTNFWITRVYDPSNGTVSRGDICRFGGEVPGPVSKFQ